MPFASWHPIGKQSEAFYQDIPINNPSNYRNRFRGKTRAIPANSNSREQQEVKAGDRSHAPERGCARPAAVGHSASLTARSCMPHLPWGGAQPLPGTKDLPGRETSATAISGCSQRVGPWPRTGGLGLQPVLASLAWAATRTIPRLLLTGALSLPWVWLQQDEPQLHSAEAFRGAQPSLLPGKLCAPAGHTLHSLLPKRKAGTAPSVSLRTPATIYSLWLEYHYWKQHSCQIPNADWSSAWAVQGNGLSHNFAFSIWYHDSFGWRAQGGFVSLLCSLPVCLQIPPITSTRLNKNTQVFTRLFCSFTTGKKAHCNILSTSYARFNPNDYSDIRIFISLWFYH